MPVGVAARQGKHGGSHSTLATGTTIAAVGNFDRHSGLRTAVWAFDVLKYVSPALWLLLIGDGPGREAVDRFGRALGSDDYRVRFAGHCPNVPALLAAAAVTWVTHDRGGLSVAAESLAAGTPVIAFRTPDTESVIDHGTTGILVPHGDRVGLATATADFLLDRLEDLCRLGEAGKRVAAERFAVGPLATATAAAYAELKG
jgi:glycosyltransferase involved in cell wall biosynthesis